MDEDERRPHDRMLDLRGLACPLPVLKARKALAAMGAGERLLVLASDPMAAIDLPHFCATEGHAVLDMAEKDGVLRFLIARGGGSAGVAGGAKGDRD